MPDEAALASEPQVGDGETAMAKVLTVAAIALCAAASKVIAARPFR
jgi:hypothetical protein